MVVVDVDANVAWLSLTWTVTWRGCRWVVVGDVVDGNVAWLSVTLWTVTWRGCR